jgi:hypothetical protein
MRFALPAAVLTLLAFSLSCHEGDTVIVNSDCGLVRSDLVGTWTFSFPAGSTKLFNCSDAQFNNKDVVLPSGSVFSYNDIQVFASGSNVGFFFHNGTSPEQVFGNVETDSCGMLFAFMINASSSDPTPLYLQCIGTLDRHSGIVNASCDSATVLQSPLTDPVTIAADCDLSLFVPATVSIK